MNDPILMYGDEPIGQLYKNSKAQSTSIARVVTNPLTGDGISQGSGFMLDGKRCVALINIATGTTMVEHTHYEYESVEEKINEISTPVAFSVTASSGITIAGGSFVKMGKVVSAKCEITNQSALSAWAILATGFPHTPGKNVETLLWNGTGNIVPAYVDNSGNFRIRTSAASGTWFMNVTYLLE